MSKTCHAFVLVLGGLATSIAACAAPPEENAASHQESGLIGPNCRIDPANIWHARSRAEGRPGTIEHWSIYGQGDCSESRPDCIAWLRSKGATQNVRWRYFPEQGGMTWCTGDVGSSYDPNDRDPTVRTLPN
ncbi:MAG: hypothetical protein JNL38_32020 [Myxococcales bacterium]|jgi:hypothetical protein|nr:hypothetical protein [Myxococcales bacterium]